MCGIAGYVDFSDPVDPTTLTKMTGVIAHRGPDSSGRFISKGKEAGLGIRRLSIIDLKTGDQPIKNEDGSICVVYNGEIYNYQKLKKELLKKGHKFRTKTDTEVLVHLYEEYGTKMTGKLNGMFAFALWDENERRLFLGRDRVGIKPLYYFQRGKSLIFASEPKAILENEGYVKKVNPDAVSLYFYFGYIPGTKSIFSGISKLLPGHTLSFSARGVEIEKYFELSFKSKKERSLDRLLKSAVSSQLMADVPVGVFLSGGLDSSLVAYYISRIKKLKSFSIGFEEEGFDESAHAHYVARRLGTEHYSETFSAKDVIDLFPKISAKLDEPLADSSLFPTYKVSALARRHVKVALSGDGGDELFGGYPTYQAHILAGVLDMAPRFVHDVLMGTVNALPESAFSFFPTSFKDYSKKRLAKIVLSGLKKKNPERHLYWMRTFFLGERKFGKNPDMNFLEGVIPEARVSSARKGQVIDFYTYLPDDFLTKVDRASMFNSLETRVPYLDNDVIDYAFSTQRPHVSVLKTKIQLRDLLKKRLPDIANRPKKGFGIPLEKWLRGELAELTESYLSEKKLYHFVDKKDVTNIWNAYRKERENNAGLLWALVVFSGWVRNWA